MNLHDDALDVLGSWTAPDAAQEQHRQRILAHLEEHPEGMRRECFPAHVTAGTLVLSHDGQAVLLNLHRKAKRWFAFGGHCEEQDETLAGVALREALEESGLSSLDFIATPVQLDEHAVPFCDPRGTVAHLDVRFVAVAPEGAAHAASDESLDVRWWPVDQLPEGLEDDMDRLIALARDLVAAR
ncbi:ADP-ribose pyrophosphatase YjhB (NUDIX family) [Nocardioides daedukensis]|uniref:ADP-ribose pyrophosphatase YjhB (NUDIX family) n=1 Tax=Nocardioides daedukensis TaxID=634462 RepID=A0A7Y9UW44_9ACTN|nr:ADP-ribose pyrophosphatase YjhB (NUDIX family) [Nocardioides daedukensis]